MLQLRANRALFFHYGPGYTQQALEAAHAIGIELYQLNVEERLFSRLI